MILPRLVSRPRPSSEPNARVKAGFRSATLDAIHKFLLVLGRFHYFIIKVFVFLSLEITESKQEPPLKKWTTEMTADLNTLSLSELKKLAKDVAKAIESFEERQKDEARAALEAKARELGFSVSDLFASSKGGKSKRPAKYRSPDNPELTWSGRGRQPAWIKDALKAGRALEDFLILP